MRWLLRAYFFVGFDSRVVRLVKINKINFAKRRQPIVIAKMHLATTSVCNYTAQLRSTAPERMSFSILFTSGRFNTLLRLLLWVDLLWHLSDPSRHEYKMYAPVDGVMWNGSASALNYSVGINIK